MRVSNLKSPFHLDRKAPQEQTAPSKPHFSFSTQKLQENDFLAEPLVQKDVEIASGQSQFSGRAKHRWTVVDPPHLQFVIGHWQRSIPPELHSPAELLELYRRRHTRTGKTGKRPHTTPGAVVRITPRLGTIQVKRSSKRAQQRLRTTQGRKLRERLHGRRPPRSLYRTSAPLADPSRAVVMYTRLLAHNRSRRRSVADKDKEAEVVGFDGCINVPVMDVNTVYGHIYHAYYVAKRDEYSRVPQGIG